MDKEPLPFLEFVTNFAEVSNAERDGMLDIINFSSHDRNEVLIKEGEVCERMAFILEGAVCIYHSDNQGNMRPFHFRFENEPLGDYESFEGQTPAGFNAIALEPTTVIWANHKDFFDFMSSFPKYEGVMTKALSKELATKNEHFKLIGLESAKERYEALCKKRPDIIKRVPLKYIASYLGMAMETLSRIRAGKV